MTKMRAALGGRGLGRITGLPSTWNPSNPHYS
jgi:hypothetical protein